MRNIICFSLSVWSHIISTSSSWMLDLKNLGISIRILLISCLKAQRNASEIKRSPSWIFILPVWSQSILICPNGELDPANVGISLMSCLEAEILVFAVLRPPSWISQFRFGCTVSDLVPWNAGLQNMGVAVGILSIASLDAEKHAIEVYRLPSWIFHFRFLPVWS